MLLLGAGGAGAAPLRIPRVKPARAIAETIELVRGLLRGDDVPPSDGEVITFGGGTLHLPTRADLPIYVATRE